MTIPAQIDIGSSPQRQFKLAGRLDHTRTERACRSCEPTDAPMREAISAYLERIRRVFPTLQNFGVGTEEFETDERDYKFEPIQLFQQNVAARLASVFIANSAVASVVDDLIRTFTVRLSHEPTQNLVDWRYAEPIENLSAARKAEFAQRCAKLVYLTKDIAS